MTTRTVLVKAKLPDKVFGEMLDDSNSQISDLMSLSL
jgi:hypothetical protein